MSCNVAVVGAGAVGVNVAIFLRKLGFGVNLIDSAPDILQGSPMVSFINHGDGFEYYKEGHRRTGEFCIDGSITKGLVYPLEAIKTPICTEESPIRFLVAEGSVKQGVVDLEGFYQNAECMKLHFEKQFQAVMAAHGLSEDQVAKFLLRRPSSFCRILGPSDLVDVDAVVGGCAGSSFGINMPHYYALLKAALRDVGVDFHPIFNVEAIERARAAYQIHSEGSCLAVECIILASGHHIPFLVSKIRGVECLPPALGVYYLNSMTFLNLPATTDQEKLLASRRINFTLQQDYGAMFACIVPPSENEDGLGVIYYPSSRGSQLKSHVFDPSRPVAPPAEWDLLMREGLPNDSPHVLATFEQACGIYPFLRGYGSIVRTTCRAVFNRATRDSDNGADRRVREISRFANVISSDGRVSAWTSPKWTNAELVALMAADYVWKQLHGSSLAMKGESQFGPIALDAVRIADVINCLDLKMEVGDALYYAALQGIPSRVVDRTLPQFRPAEF